MKPFKVITQEPYTWAIQINDKLDCIYIYPEEIPNILKANKHGLWFTINEGVILAIKIDPNGLVIEEYTSTDDIATHYNTEELKHGINGIQKQQQ
jgi:hypothetical protein